MCCRGVVLVIDFGCGRWAAIGTPRPIRAPARSNPPDRRAARPERREAPTRDCRATAPTSAGARACTRNNLRRRPLVGSSRYLEGGSLRRVLRLDGAGASRLRRLRAGGRRPGHRPHPSPRKLATALRRHPGQDPTHGEAHLPVPAQEALHAGAHSVSGPRPAAGGRRAERSWCRPASGSSRSHPFPRATTRV